MKVVDSHGYTVAVTVNKIRENKKITNPISLIPLLKADQHVI